MFEKEAEERITEQFGTSGEYVTRQRIWQDGAEFGYNKAKIEVEESYRESLCNSELNLASVTEQLEELEKANEWHYCKDELPDHNGQFYVALKGYKETYILSYDYDEDNDDKMAWIDEDGTNFDEEVYAWCEKLKAPEIKEE